MRGNSMSASEMYPVTQKMIKNMCKQMKGYRGPSPPLQAVRKEGKGSFDLTSNSSWADGGRNYAVNPPRGVKVAFVEISSDRNHVPLPACTIEVRNKVKAD